MSLSFLLFSAFISISCMRIFIHYTIDFISILAANLKAKALEIEENSKLEILEQVVYYGDLLLKLNKRERRVAIKISWVERIRKAG